MEKKEFFIIRIKLFFIEHKEALLRAIKIALDLWDMIQTFIIPMF